jgi:type I restriction enzyme S subunit
MEVREPSAKYLAKAGYKQTEMGLIPKDWEVVLLHMLADKIMVGIASAATHAYRDRGVVMFRNQNIKQGYLDDADILYIAEDYEVTFKNKRLKAGDLLTARTGYPGTTSIVPGQYEGAQSFTTLITRPRQGTVDSEFLCCFINSEAGQKYFSQAQIGGGQKNVNAGAMKHLPVCLPPTVAEQKAIAEALRDSDALIESLEQLLAKKRQIKQGAMQELLTGQRRLPGFGGEWEVKRLGDVAEMASGGTPPSSNLSYYDGAIPWAAIADITKTEKYLETTERNLSAAGLANCPAKMFPIGTVLYAMYASLGECSVANASMSSSQAILGIQTKPALNNEFLYYFLQSIRPFVKGMGQQGTQANLNKGMVQDFQLNLPPLEEQTAIAAVFSDMDTEIAALEAKLAKARHLKQGMMQELLTGRIRLV